MQEKIKNITKNFREKVANHLCQAEVVISPEIDVPSNVNSRYFKK